MLVAKDLYLSVGQKINANILGLKYQLSICGWLENSYIITNVPMMNGDYLHLAPETGIHVNFVKDGRVVSFDSRVVVDHSKPPLYMIIEFPRLIEKVNMRKHERIKTNLPVLYRSMDDTVTKSGTIFDVSLGGALLTHVDNLKKGAPIIITVELSALNLKIENLMSTVQNVREFSKHKGVTYISGLMYSNFSENNRKSLQSIIDFNKVKTE